LTAQRALSFLPGKWDYEAKAAAEESSEWRFYMWQQALTTPEFIKNKLLGDGFGFSAYELQIMQQEVPNGGSPFIGGDRQESQLIQGTFHSGPISAIRFVGYVGLVLYLVLSFVAAFYAWRLIRTTAATSFFPLALFIGISVIYGPIEYIFVFGGYESGFPRTIFLCGMLRLLSEGFSRWRRGQSDVAPEVQELANSSA
jgi:O-antigen ligase